MKKIKLNDLIFICSCWSSRKKHAGQPARTFYDKMFGLFSNNQLTDGWKIGITIYEIRIYENKTRNLKGAVLNFVGILAQYALSKMADLGISEEVVSNRNLIDIRSRSYKSMKTIEVEIKNKDVLKILHSKQGQGTWVKVYDAAYLNEQRAEIHYFLRKETGTYYDSKIKQMGWSKQFLKGKNKVNE